MKSHSIVITDSDFARLGRLTRALQYSRFRDQQQLDLLDHVLQSADVRSPPRTPKSVVRMNSRVHVRDIDTRKEEVYTVVFPDEANASRGLISVLAPIGIALIGHRKGTLVEVEVPGRIRRLQIIQVTQSPNTPPEEELSAGPQITQPTFVVEGGVPA